MITLWLDKPGRMEEDRKWFEESRTEINEREVSDKQLHFGSGGSFVVRLPAYDLVDAVATRWAREMLHAFLVGEARGELAFSLDQVNAPPRSVARTFQ